MLWYLLAYLAGVISASLAMLFVLCLLTAAARREADEEEMISRYGP